MARLSPFVRQHINMLGCYSFHLPDLPGGLRPLRDPASPNGRVICRWAGAFLVGRRRPRFSSAGCRPLVGAALVNGGVDVVAQQVGVVVGEGPVQVPQDYFVFGTPASL
ncbi:hypothetical protein [Streptomyces sp. NPDC048637]|uniref:hypothetical protein n=1 Tax=Streptomyces sp. NPDC048637 TaxID=3155636 RepID=UPI0034344EE9